jgi:hypothetical protein
MPDGSYVAAPVGYKLMKIMLKNILSSEGRAGYLIQRNCEKVLVRPKGMHGKFLMVGFQIF